MPNTTNYNWATPADSDLVKDGAAAIRTLGSSIDSTLKTQIDAQIPDSLLTTKGDLIAATGASTPARLGVGSNDQVLMADSSASTGLKWGTVASGGQTLLSTTTLSGASTTISSISQDYKHLVILLSSGTINTGGQFYMRFNGLTGSVYNNNYFAGSGGLQYVQLVSAFRPGASSGTSGYNCSFVTNVPFYSFSSVAKSWQTESGAAPNWTDNVFFSVGNTNTLVDAITSVTFLSNNGENMGGTVRIYGVN